MIHPWLAVLLVITAVLLITALLWLVIPAVSGLAWVPTRVERIRKALQLAGVQPGETLVDLGAGDGRVLFIAAREFAARAIGVEISPVHCLMAWLRARFSPVRPQISIRCMDLFRADLHDADVVFAYMTSRQSARLRPILEQRMRPGTRVVTVSFDIDGWQPSQFDRQNLLFLYEMPPTPGSLDTYLAQQP